MRKVTCILLILSLLLCISCKKKAKTDTIEKQETELGDWQYETDSGKVAVIVFGEDGSTEYVVDNPENIFQKTHSGIEYRIIESHQKAKQLKIGDILYLNMEYRTQDSILFNSKDLDETFKIRLNRPSCPGSIEEALLLLKEGDSAVFKIDAVKYFINTQNKVNIPAYIKEGDKLIFHIRVIESNTDSEFASKNQSTYTYYKEQEESMISRFVLNYKDQYPLRTFKDGLRIMTIDKGDGDIKQGSTVTIDYTAAFIDGSVFDSTLERKEPFTFHLGKNEVIVGLEEAVLNMKKGEHSLVVIPFNLAYGDKKYHQIPPFSTLVFEIEILDAK